MLEKIHTPGYSTISKPDMDVLFYLKEIMNISQPNERYPIVGEIGVGIGATTLPMAEILSNYGEIHIFDFETSVQELQADLRQREFTNIVAHGNTDRYWDSYHWSLAEMIRNPINNEIFDLIYIDGAHTYLHDALAFFQCDRLLKVGGFMIFDDYNWRYADSKYMKGKRLLYMTQEQVNAFQINMFIEDLVSTHIGYETVKKNKIFRKILAAHQLDKSN